MNAAWLHREGHARVLIVFAGWGMDEALFRRLSADRRDVFVYYDFRRLDEVPDGAAVEAYPDRALVAWSLGCAAANHVARERRWTFSRALAVNGTLFPQDDRAGVPARWIAATAQRLTDGGWERFIERMCPDAESRAAFDAGRPCRDLQSSVEELEALCALPAPQACIFHSALVSEFDRIIRPENQRNCWSRHAVPVRSIRAPHYPFHLWSTWEEVLACAV